MALRVAASFKTPKRLDDSPVVLVLDFTQNSSGISSVLGTLLADKFSERLKAVAGVEVIDRRLYKNYLKENGIKIEDTSSDEFCRGIINDLGATDFVRANLTANLTENVDEELKISLEGVGSRSVFHDEVKFPITKGMGDFLSQPVPAGFFTEQKDIPPEPGVLALDSKPVEGLVPPRCISCPDPKYSEVARKAKVQGTIELSAVVTMGGEITSVYVLRGLPGGLTQRAIEAVKTWKMQPAMKDGRPVTVRIQPKITFRTS